VNGDGFDDAVFVVGPSGFFAPRISVYLGAASPATFRPAGLLLPGTAPSPVSCFSGVGPILAADLDANGKADVVLGLPLSGPGCTGEWGAVAVYRF